MLDVFFNAVSNNRLGDLAVPVLIVICAWLYKEIRTSLMEADKYDAERINKALQVYAKLESTIIKCKLSFSENFYDNLADAYPFIHKELLRQAYNLKKNFNSADADKFLAKLEEEIFRLKNLQTDLTSNERHEYFVNEVDFFIKKTKMKSFILPLIFILIALTVVIFYIVFLYEFEKANIFGKLNLGAGASYLLSIMFILSLLVDVFINFKFIHTRNNWIKLVLMCILPIILYFVAYMQSDFEIHNYVWIIAIIGFALNITYLVKCFHNSIIREKRFKEVQ
ncbi:MAG: hypothetical protein ACRKFN_11910 [Desulfitobacterium sp.]